MSSFSFLHRWTRKTKARPKAGERASSLSSTPAQSLLLLRWVHAGDLAPHRHGRARRLTLYHLHLIRSCSSSAAHTGRLLAAGARLLSILLVLLGSRCTANLLLRARLLYHPVEDKVVFVAHAVEEVLEELAQVANVRLLLELEAAAIVQIDTEFVRKVLCQRLDRR